METHQYLQVYTAVPDPLTPYSYQEPMDSRLRSKIVCHTHGVGRDWYTHEVIDANSQHTEEGHQEEIVKKGRDRSAHNLNVDIMIVVHHILTLKNNEYVKFL